MMNKKAKSVNTFRVR
jgi:Fe2+ transport system protein FeoA